MLGETLNETELSQKEELTKKLEATGGVPEPSKSMLDAVEKAKKKAAKVSEV
jgi:hypothetical protein